MREVMWIWPARQIVLDSLSAFGRVDYVEAVNNGSIVRGRCQGRRLARRQKAFYSSPYAGPELDLAGDGALRGGTCDAGVEDEFIGELDGLAHAKMVA